ncbi:MAG: hypothetical protein R3E31_29485 [Chloroflexota bacterium]
MSKGFFAGAAGRQAMSSGRKWGYNGNMTIETNFRFVAVMEEGVVALPLAAGAAQFDDLLAGLPVGVYSALRTFDHNRFLYLEAHLTRTERSMRLLGWADTLDRPRLCAALHEVVTAVPWPDSRVRFDMLAQPAPEQLGVNGRLLIAAMPLTPVRRRSMKRGWRSGWRPDCTARIRWRKRPFSPSSGPPSGKNSTAACMNTFSLVMMGICWREPVPILGRAAGGAVHGRRRRAGRDYAQNHFAVGSGVRNCELRLQSLAGG